MGDSRPDVALGAEPAPIPIPPVRRRISIPDGTQQIQPATSNGAAQPTAARPQASAEPPPAPTDPDTCRICRGEGTEEEPLFYPCKCSGSIKFVHQDCLMEWLSHSQKKHCELCKTSFRFTKLYHPTMPQSLPFFVFVHHMTRYFLRNFLVWLRATLVASVWLGWLPYLMRSVWSFLFWISDEGLGGGPLFSRHNDTLRNASDSMSFPIYSTAVCPSSPLFAATTTVASIGGVIDNLPFHAVQLVKSLDGINLTSINPLYSTLLRFLFGGVGLTDQPTTNNFTILHNVPIATNSPPSHSSLLSEVGFLRNLTRSPAVNKTVIAILEGQIITILVIVCFILIILVRDYVVQQQPEINMRAAFAAPENAPAPDPLRPHEELAANRVVIENLPPADGHRDDSGERDILAELDETVAAAWADDDLASPDRSAPARPEPPTIRFSRADKDASSRANLDGISSWSGDEIGGSSSGVAVSSQSEQPRPARSSSLRSAGVGESGSDDGSTIHEYLMIYREAEGDPERILKIAKEKDLEDKLEYWIRVTRSMMDRNKNAKLEEGEASRAGTIPGTQIPSGVASTPQSDQGVASWGPDQPSRWEWPDNVQIEHMVSFGEKEKAEGDAQASHWAWSDAEKLRRVEELGFAKKGKEKAQDEGQPAARFEDDGSALPGSLLRPRANTDGPQIPQSPVNPLANNSWSFSDLPPEPLTASTSASFGEPLTKQNAAPAVDSASEFSFPTPPSSTLAESGTPDSRNRSPSASARPSAAGEEDTPASDEASTQPDNPDFDFNTPPAVRFQNDATAGPARRQPVTLADRLADFMWHDVDAINPEELVGPPDPDAEDFLDNDGAPFAEPAAIEGEGQDALERDREVAEAAVAAGLDPEAIEDAEDFEGIMELIGMRGPIAGLFQNAIFCAFLVSITIFLGVFLPYNIGRITVWTIANPTRLARMLFGVSKFIQDIAVIVFTTLTFWVLTALSFIGRMMGSPSLAMALESTTAGAWNMTANAGMRIMDNVFTEYPVISPGEVRNFSALSHDALLTVKGYIFFAVAVMGDAVMYVFGGDYSTKSMHAVSFAANATSMAWAGMKVLPGVLSDPGSWVINLSLPETASTVNPELAYWGGMDRLWATIGGYSTLAVVAALYLRRGRPFSSSQTGQEWEASIIDGLNQASGVMKVILIIGIEMLIFPLYCGLLLDVALLPLFENTTMMSRLLFTINYPLTSIFVHWFVGTGYMFHFALFVSMCRKIMRKGVLYFIRDPDDPEFHPVRDVLERNVTTQLRKILFSAFVYGGLVVICLGGVVWGLSCSVSDVLPIHYSSNEPVLEFPIDLLFYNFLMPLAVKFFKPSDGLHAMYTWWFRKCGRALRITWFLFGERRIDEEGVLAMAPSSRNHALPWWRKMFLELAADRPVVVPKTWHDAFEGGTAKPRTYIAEDEMTELVEKKALLVKSKQLVPDGRFVRAPASDQVKIPRGKGVFFDVSERNVRTDEGTAKFYAEYSEIYSTSQYQMVYIPPFFRLRVFLFIMFIWIFAAVTGVGITIVPLVFGRHMFKLLIPAHIRTNDIYAFSIGIYILGTVTYSIFHIRAIYRRAKDWMTASMVSLSKRDAVQRAMAIGTLTARLAYSYTFLLLVFPLLVASLMELYLLIPLNTYMYSAMFSNNSRQTSITSHHNTTLISDAVAPIATSLMIEFNPHHSVRVIQAWTIGLLYLKLAARVITVWYGHTRLAAATRAVLRRGWLDPDVKMLTRAFVIPLLIIWLLAVCLPLLAARVSVAYGAAAALIPQDIVSPELRERYLEAALVLVYRFSFPATAIFAVSLAVLWNFVGVFQSWRVRIRDEAYLIGERLHNFGVGAGPGRARGAWRAGGTRL